MGFFTDKVPQLITPKKVALEKSEVSEVKTVASGKEAIAGNVELFDSVTGFMDDLNAYMAKASVDILESTIPGITALRSALTERGTELARNPFDLPKGVQDLIETQAAQRGVATGVGLDSEAGALDLVETFGLKGIELGQQNLRTAQSLARTVTSIAPTPSPVNPFAFFSSTQDVQGARERFETQRLATDIRFKEATQTINQAFENAKAAVANQQAVIDASKRSTFQRITEGVSGAVQGFAAGGPAGAVAGGVGAAAGRPFDPSVLEGLGDLSLPGTLTIGKKTFGSGAR